MVRAGDGETVGAIVLRAGEVDAESAIAEGRVFVGRERAKGAAQIVKVGDEVKIGVLDGSRAAATAATGTSAKTGPAPAFAVLWSRDGLLACDKPAGIPTVPDHAGAAHSLVALAAASCGKKAGELFVTSRLDREVSGVVIFATTPQGEAHLRRARDVGAYVRRYVAIAAISPSTDATLTTLIASIHVDQPSPTGTWAASIGAGKDPRHRAVGGADAKPAQTRFAVIARAGGFVLLAVEPQTGRTHQIRVHAAHAGAPLLGDRDYGGPTRVTLPNGGVVALSAPTPRIALHAARVVVPDPAQGPGSGPALVATAPVPAAVARVWAELGGAPEAWDTALSCVIEGRSSG